MKNQQMLAETLQERLEFMISQLPEIEKLIAKLQDSISKAPMSDKTLDELFAFYRQVYTFYNRSLELVRKIVVYFPPQVDSEEKELLVKWRDLSSASRLKVDQLINELNANTPETPGVRASSSEPAVQ